MIHNLPEEIIIIILSKIDVDPIQFLNLKNINHQYCRVIDNFKDIYFEKGNNFEGELDILCKKHSYNHS